MASGIKEYDVELDGVVLTPPVTAPTVSKAISGLAAGTEHDVRVRSRDNAGNVSAWSSVLTVTTTGGGGGGAVLLAAYNFNEGSGAAQDKSGNGRHMASTSYTASGTGHGDAGYACRGGVVASAAACDPFETDSRSFSCWVKDDPAGPNPWPLRFQNNALDTGGWGLISTGTIGVRARSSSVNHNLTVTYPTPSAWHHWAGPYDADTDETVLYLDGVEVATGSFAGPFLGTDAIDIALGSTSSTMLVDDLRLYSGVITPAQVITDRDTPVA
ncbi:LamG-like jellyroll fold domain-containing protein [Mumia sp. DW29H23]|uniref:LamG-like jellyroll fold domain-containing protein n=1 Tax=Mumia sp. DW29H23 TaxID=3421241 RepID=UPI003D690069